MALQRSHVVILFEISRTFDTDFHENMQKYKKHN